MGRGGGMVVVTLEGVLKLLSKRLKDCKQHSSDPWVLGTLGY